MSLVIAVAGIRVTGGIGRENHELEAWEDDLGCLWLYQSGHIHGREADNGRQEAG